MTTPSPETLGRPLRLTRGGGLFRTLFGLPFLGAGLGVNAIGLHALWSDPNFPWLALLFMVPFGSAFAVVGASVSFGRSGVDLDVASGTATSWWGLVFLPLSRKQRPLADFKCVTLGREVRRGNKSTYTVFPVRLEGDGAPLELEEPLDFDTARRRSELVAKTLAFGIRDHSTEVVVWREPERLDESIRDRARRLKEPAPQVPVPENPRATLVVEGGTVSVVLPPGGFVGAGLLLGAGLLVFTVSSVLMAGAVWFLLFPGALIGVPLLARALGKTRLVASYETLLVEQSLVIPWRSISIPAQAIEELYVSAPRGTGLFSRPQLIVRTDARSLLLGESLSEAELGWIAAEVRQALIGR